MADDSRYTQLTHAEFGKASVVVYEYVLDWGELDEYEREYFEFPEDLWTFDKLERLEMLRCPHQYIPPELGSLTSLTFLGLEGFEFLSELPSTIRNLKHLKHLDIRACDSLSTLPPEIRYLKNLETLKLMNNFSLRSLPPEIGQLEKLTMLAIVGAGIAVLPREIFQLKSLVDLAILNCDDLTELSGDIGQLQNLTDLYIAHCDKLARLPDELGLLSKNLTTLSIITTTIAIIPPALGGLANLEDLTIYNSIAESLPNELGNLKRLKMLRLQCPHLREFPSGLENMVALENLLVTDFASNFGDIVTRMKRLKHLRLVTCARESVLTMFAKHSPESCQFDDVELISCGLGNDYVKILPVLPRRLKKLSVYDEGIQDLSGLLLGRLPERIRGISVRASPPVEDIVYGNERLAGIISAGDIVYSPDDQSRIKLLLERYPQLSSLDHGKIRWGLFPNDILYQLCLNKCGRVLLCESESIPMSVWPTVLSRIFGAMAFLRQHPKLGTKIMEASMIFELLRGPALGCRPASDKLDLPRKRKVDDSVS